MVTIDLDLTLRVILYLVAIVCLLFCIYFFVKLIKMFGRINTILEKSEESLISSAEKLPDLIENTDKAIVNANEILEKTDEILADKKEDITESIENVNLTFENVKDITEDINVSTRFVAEQVVDTTMDIRENVDIMIDKVDMIMNIIETIRSYFRKK